ncbi:glycoside hydrolase family 68 protein [Pontibacillus salipaludis]|uniref:Levansucrase n=1 Tax=Pontibacillus salipaludis TaxID=1697394 RepID=A0ABQ1Q0W9_9BACI|nr:glycoside hydrolase family 68 protein [Pontibacillus salipaludis]GGD09421.1 hypothetical protein GCM10011389_16160 [Pontibacillus salipaludis]
MSKKKSTFTRLALTTALISTLFATSPMQSVKAETTDTNSVTTAEWTRQMAQNFVRTSENTAPEISADFKVVADDLWIWDTWPLRNRDGSLAEINGYKVQFALTASKEYTWSGRHDHAVIRYFISEDGENWEVGGVAYDPEKAYGSRQWAGSAMVDDSGKVTLFYTASGRKENETAQNHFEQRLAKTELYMFEDEGEFTIENTGDHQILAEADGTYYETQDQKTGSIIYSFRDPWFFQDPETGEEYILFEGNTAGYDKELDPSNIGDEEFRATHDVPEGSEDFNGNIGIAKATDKSLDNFELLPPLLEADGVNQQLERPHIVVKDGNYHLFTISHQFTFAPGLDDGIDGLYGFVNDSLRGDYKPMNDNGLVVANPESDPFQAYSWAVLPNENVISFINEFSDNGQDIKGGQFAPTLEINLDGENSEITGVLNEGEIDYPETEEDTTPAWSAESLEDYQLTEETTAPNFDVEELDQMTEDYHVWDTWPLRNKDGSIAKVKGQYVLFSLTAPSDVLPGKRHDIAEIRYFTSKDGQNWELAGEVFEGDDALGSRQWAGSAMVENNELHMFYTATGRKGEENLSYEQRLATASAKMTGQNGVTFKDWSEHQVILEPEGELYQTQEQSEAGDIAYTFRDPWFFQDPQTNEEYILFEANTPGTPLERARENHKPNEFATIFNGSIGIAKATNDDYTEFEAQEPLLEAERVNQELERPHIVVEDGEYYLFTNTHKHKFGPGLAGEDGLYGFNADSLKGDYQPLNESGLVIANPEEDPFQAYSWMVMPNMNVLSFANFDNLNGLEIGDLGAQSEDYQFNHFGGTLAPTLQLDVDGMETSIEGTLDQGQLFEDTNNGKAKGKK